MSREILLLVDALAHEKNVAKEVIFTALELALASANKKRFAEVCEMVVQWSDFIGNQEKRCIWNDAIIGRQQKNDF